MKKIIGLITLLLGAVLLILVIGCEKSKPVTEKEVAPSSEGTNALPAGLILAEAPSDALAVTEAKSKLQVGDDIVVQGRIGGRLDPFVEGRAIFMLVDLSMPTCADNPADSCKTPWDYCCEPPDEVAAKSVSVEIDGADGKPLHVTLAHHDGLKPMAKVTVRGKVVQKPNDKTMVVRADGIFVQGT